jgi:hypothetical protein
VFTRDHAGCGVAHGLLTSDRRVHREGAPVWRRAVPRRNWATAEFVTVARGAHLIDFIGHGSVPRGCALNSHPMPNIARRLSPRWGGVDTVEPPGVAADVQNPTSTAGIPAVKGVAFQPPFLHRCGVDPTPRLALHDGERPTLLRRSAAEPNPLIPNGAKLRQDLRGCYSNAAVGFIPIGKEPGGEAPKLPTYEASKASCLSCEGRPRGRLAVGTAGTGGCGEG